MFFYETKMWANKLPPFIDIVSEECTELFPAQSKFIPLVKEVSVVMEPKGSSPSSHKPNRSPCPE
jgi:hypothetical protein